MNPEICKKCDKDCAMCFQKHDIKHFIISHEFFMSNIAEMVLVSEKIFYHNNKNWLCIKDKIKKVIGYTPEEKDFNKIKLNKDCPYYIEHELYDWNKGKTNAVNG